MLTLADVEFLTRSNVAWNLYSFVCLANVDTNEKFQESFRQKCNTGWELTTVTVKRWNIWAFSQIRRKRRLLLAAGPSVVVTQARVRLLGGATGFRQPLESSTRDVWNDSSLLSDWLSERLCLVQTKGVNLLWAELYISQCTTYVFSKKRRWVICALIIQ